MCGLLNQGAVLPCHERFVLLCVLQANANQNKKTDKVTQLLVFRDVNKDLNSLWPH